MLKTSEQKFSFPLSVRNKISTWDFLKVQFNLKLKLLLWSRILIVNYSFHLLNQLVFLKKNIGTLLKIFHKQYHILKLPLLQKIMKIIFLKLNISMINQLEPKKRLISSNEMKNYMNGTVLIMLNYLILNFWKEIFTEITLHFFLAKICNWVCKQCKSLPVTWNLLLQKWSTL